MSTNNQQTQDQQQIIIGKNLDGQEKYVLQLLMKIDNSNAQNLQIYNELMAFKRELESLKKESNEILQEYSKVQQELSKCQAEITLLKAEKESMLTELGKLRALNSSPRKKVPVLEEAIEDFDDGDMPKEPELN